MKTKFERFGAPTALATFARATGLLVISIAAASVMSTAAQGSVVGTLETGSSGTVTATLTALTFSNDSAALGGTNFACPVKAPACNSDVASGTSLTFAGCTGTLGTGTCLSTTEGVNVSNGTISGASIGETNFLTFSNNANLVYSLGTIQTYVGDSSVSTDCAGLSAGGSCTAYVGAPILLTDLSPVSTLVSFNVTGNASDTGTAGLATGSTYEGGFSQTLTTPLQNGAEPSAANIQLFFCGTNASPTLGTCETYEAANTLPAGETYSVTSSQSGSFTANSVPEPNTLALMLIGGILIGATRIRRSKA